MAKKIRFNLMDLIIILVAALVIFGGVYVLKSLKGGTASGETANVNIRYTVELTKEDEEILNLFLAAAERGDRCYVGEQERAEAVIKDVTYTPAKLLNNNTETGEVFWADVPGKYCINVTLESEGTASDSEITAGSGTVLKVGDETAVKGKGYAGYGFIIDLETTSK